LQSIGGSLRLPLLQNGACPFPCTPLLSALMRVTQTDREVLTMCPGVRVMAVSMEGVERTRAGIASMPTEMVHLQRVSLWAEQPTIGTAPALPCEPGGQPGADRRVASPSRAPVNPIPLVRAPVACDLGVPQAGDLTMGGERPLACGGGRCGTHPAGVPWRWGVACVPSGGASPTGADPPDCRWLDAPRSDHQWPHLESSGCVDGSRPLGARPDGGA
jgi:hypothetical protein